MDRWMPRPPGIARALNENRSKEEIMVQGETTIRVRYAETDRMGLLHHANYLVYFEQGRTELLRDQGFSYRDIEDQGFFLVLTKVQVRYKRPAYYDDLLTLRTIVQRTTLVKIEHRYELLRDGVLVAEGETTLGCVDRQGKVQPLPDSLRSNAENNEDQIPCANS
jgi:acyl-CoA thioester hydrolase